MTDYDRDILSRIERDEAWLAGHATPPPSADAIVRAKAAMRRELKARNGNKTRWASWTGALAAAAMIALAVWAAMHGASSMPAVRNQEAAPIAQRISEPELAPIESLAAETSDGSSDLRVAFDSRQEALEDWSKDDNWDITGGSLAEAMNDLFGDAAKKKTDGT